MESELSGIFRVKLVAKNIVLGFPGTHSAHMRVTEVRDLWNLQTFSLYYNFLSQNLPLRVI